MKRFKGFKGFKGILFIMFLLCVLYLFTRSKGVVEYFSFLKKPHLSDGDTIYIKTVNDKYVTSCAACFPIDANIDNRCKKNFMC